MAGAAEGAAPPPDDARGPRRRRHGWRSCRTTLAAVMAHLVDPVPLGAACRHLASLLRSPALHAAWLSLAGAAAAPRRPAAARVLTFRPRGGAAPRELASLLVRTLEASEAAGGRCGGGRGGGSRRRRRRWRRRQRRGHLGGALQGGPADAEGRQGAHASVRACVLAFVHVCALTQLS
jgi:hypothetical protein